MPSYNLTVTNHHPRIRLRRVPILQAVQRALSGQGRKTAIISIVLTTDEYLLELNKRYLQHDYYTDVITFPLEDLPVLEGEVYISIDRAKEQAAEHKVGLYTEVKRLAIHGALHLMGYDDRTVAERLSMKSLEDAYL